MLQQSAKWMADLPVELIRYGKVVAIISSPEKFLENNTTENLVQLHQITAAVPDETPKVKYFPAQKDFSEEIDQEDPLDIARCVMPNCALKGPKRPDWMTYNEVIGEMVKSPSYACKKHYLAFLKIKDTL